MFRVAHMNRDKTKLLVKTVDPGEPCEGTVSRPPRYNPQQILERPMVSEIKSPIVMYVKLAALFLFSLFLHFVVF